MMKPTGESGISLLEIVFATCILGLGMVPLLLLFEGSLGRVRVTRPDLIASTLSGEILDQMRLVPFADLPFGPGNAITFKLDAGKPPPAVNADLPGRIPLLLGVYPLTMNVTILVEPSTPPDLLARITVSITWDRDPRTPADPAAMVRSEWMENRLLRPATP